MKIKTGKSYSQRKELTFLIPQGYCSGANFFKMYCTTMSEVTNPNLSLTAFADNHAFVTEFNPAYWQKKYR